MNSLDLNNIFMKAILSSLIFLLALASFSAGAQAGRPLKRTLWVVKDSGFVFFSPYDLMDDESLIQKNFTHIVYVKPAGENGSLITKKHSMKPHLRIESSIGRLSFLGPSQWSTFRIDPDSMCPSYLRRGRPVYDSIIPNQLYPDGGGMSIWYCEVSGLDKKVRTLKVTVYDNLSNKILGEREFQLSPTVVHYYTTELHYTDVNGNPQIYTDETKNWIPVDTTISAKVVVRDEYGAMVAIKKFRVWSSDICGDGMVPTYEGDELPSSSWQMRNINLVGTGNRTYVITPEIEGKCKCDYVKSLRIGNVNY